MLERAKFTRFQDGTEQDWQYIKQAFVPFAKALPDRILAHLGLLAEDRGGMPVDRLTHSLQTATRAWRDGQDEEYVICALLHDIGDTLGPFNHADLAAKILKPFVSEANLWMIENHTVFQGYYYYHLLGSDRNKREQFAGTPHYDRTVEFCELYDGPAFDQKAETLPLSDFEPMLRRVLAEPRMNSLLWTKND
jgi:predicted HD phosphohydrolase